MEQEELQFIVCPVCEGAGKTKTSSVCLECEGVGAGLLFQGDFLYFGKRISTVQFFQDRLEKRVKMFLNILFFCFGLLGLGILAFYIWQSDFINITKLEFWLEPNLFMLVFWLSTLSDLYLVYRLTEESLLKEKVKRKVYEEQGEEMQRSVYQWSDTKQIPSKNKIDVSKAFSLNALNTVEETYNLAKKLKHQNIELIHLLAVLVAQKQVTIVFGRLGVEFPQLRERIAHQFAKLNSLQMNTDFKAPAPSLKFKMVLLLSYVEAYENRLAQIEPTELLVALGRQEDISVEILYDLEIDLNKIINVVEWVRINQFLRKQWESFRGYARLKPKTSMNRAMTALATPILDRFSQDLTVAAVSGQLAPCMGRENEIEEIFRVIESNRNSVILVGESGVGKTSIIEGIAQRMVTEEVPEILQDKRLVAINLSRLIGGVNPAEAQERLLVIINEAARAGNVILVINDIEKMIGLSSGQEESLDLSGILADAMNKRYVLAITAANIKNYVDYIESSPFGPAIKKVEIDEPDENEAIQILEAKAGVIEYKNKVGFSYNAIEESVKLSSKYIHDRFLPEKAIALAEEAAVYVRKHKGEGTIIKGADVAEIISQKTKIPSSKITEEEGEKLLKLEELIHQRVIGQEKAVSMVSEALRRARAELRSEDRPIVNLLFLGPTGVGKTELAKAVSEVYFGSEESMIRFDMSEYQLAESMKRLIGSDGKGGVLTEAVRQNPFALLLFDELEKAHPDILNLFLQIMDDGRLTDATGRTIDFTNVILIATSNAGAQYIQEAVKNKTEVEEIKNQLLESELKNHFRPEFLNRFDGVIVFKPLTEEEIRKITELLLIKVKNRLAEKGIELKVLPEAVIELAHEGFDSIFGARPLRRVIQEKVDNALAKQFLTGKIKRRDVVVLDKGGVISIEKAEEL